MRQQYPRSVSRVGFTFIEMMIVVMVTAIIAAMAAPKYAAAIASYRVDAAAQRIVADLRYSRAEALRASVSRAVQFYPGNNRYTLANVANIDRSDLGYVVVLGDDPYVSTLVSASFGGDAVVVFDMHGRPDSEGTVVVQCGTTQRTIQVASDGTATKL